MGSAGAITGLRVTGGYWWKPEPTQMVSLFQKVFHLLINQHQMLLCQEVRDAQIANSSILSAISAVVGIMLKSVPVTGVRSGNPLKRN